MTNKSIILLLAFIVLANTSCQKKAKQSSIDEVTTDLINLPENTPSPQDQELQDLINQSKQASSTWQEINQDKRRKAREDSIKNANPKVVELQEQNTSQPVVDRSKTTPNQEQQRPPVKRRKKQPPSTTQSPVATTITTTTPVDPEQDFSNFQVDRGQEQSNTTHTPPGRYLARFAENTVLTEKSKYVYVQMLESLAIEGRSYWPKDEIIQFNIIKNSGRLILRAIIHGHETHLSVFHPVDLKEGLKVLEEETQVEQQQTLNEASEFDRAAGRLFGNTTLAQPINTIDFIIRKTRNTRNNSFQLPVSLYYKFYVQIIPPNQ